MRSFLQKIKTNYNFAGTILLFIIAFLLLAYMMPRTRKFTYEFKVDSPWKEDDLTAPYKFAILKSDAEYQKEKDSALADLRYFFNYDEDQLDIQLNKFKKSFNDKWIEYSVSTLKIKNPDEYLERVQYAGYRQLQKDYADILSNLLGHIYIQGIVELSEVDLSLRPGSDIVILRGNLAKEKNIDALFTQKSAYEFVRTEMKEKISSDNRQPMSKYSQFLDQFEIEAFIVQNVFFDKDASDREKDMLLSSISMKKGMIQQGELIVSNGQIITPEIFQILYSLQMDYDSNQANVNSLLVLAGKLIFVFFVLLLIYVFLYNFRRELLRDLVKTLFILFMVVLMVFVASTTAKLERISFYVIPFTILPIILRTFFDERVAVFIHVLTTLLIGIIAPNSYEFIVLTIVAGLVAIFSLTNLYWRSRFFLSALLVVITYCLIYIGLRLINNGAITEKDLPYFANFGINGILTLVSFLLIYIFEKTFGFLSDTSLMELSDTNQPLIRNLSEVAPGTFQHSMQVASLAEDAIHRIGGNPLLARTGAMYHDIGKMYDPICFIENQTTGINPHDKLEFEESAGKIISHVEKGIELAKKNNLPEQIIDFIRTHHGTSTVQYFYRSYIKKYPEQEGDVMKFSYPGPKPFSKEMAVLMMADAVEAASRSLGVYTQERLSEVVEKIITQQIKDGQFEESPVTYRDITTVKEVFKTRLKNIYHARISYPS
jgi:cyclic-di-AMP phosphodiesterase PgpH